MGISSKFNPIFKTLPSTLILTTVLRLCITNKGIGFYHLATGLGGMLAFVLVGVGPLALSIFSEIYTRGAEKELSQIWCQIVGFVSFLTVPIFVFAFFHAESLISFVYGEQFRQAGDLLSLYIIFVGSATILGLDFVTSTLIISVPTYLKLKFPASPLVRRP